MDNSPGIKFGDLKKEERYKRLERNLKLTFVKQMERVKAGNDKGYCTSPTWPSISSINPDGLDTSCANGAPSLQVSRVESEVVSSSKNLRKVLVMHKNTHVEHVPMATSSVKRFPVNDLDKDRAIMPPPASDLVFPNVKKMSNVDSKHNAQDQPSNRRDLDSEVHDPSIQISSDASSYQDNIVSKSDSKDTSSHRVFFRWRVLLNDQGQLIIKGTLDCGKIARSKPVIQRFTSTKVQSIYKHIYVLDGNIVDDRNELPDYVCGKFHNGFPDDWENVYQLWRNYMAEGCQMTFRWPTPITDSDDDLNSEITDFTYFKDKQIEYNQQAHFSKSASNNGSSLGYHSKVHSDSNQNLEKSKEEKVDNMASKTQTVNQKIDDLGHSSEAKDASHCNNECSAENTTKDTNSSGANCSNSNLKNISFLYEIIREDKVRIILSNLGDKNCPPQYLDKFIDLIDCLKYILSYTTSNNHEAESKNQSQGCKKCNNTGSFSEMQETNPEDQSNNDKNKNECVKSEEIHKNERHPEYFKQIENSPQKEKDIQHKHLDSDNDIANESSDSDAYMGIPNVSLSSLIKSQVPRSQRYRNRKTRSNDRRNIDKDVQTEKQTQTIPYKQSQQHCDSSVTILEDDYERRIQEKKNERFPSSEPFKDKDKNSTMNNVKQANIRKSEVDNEQHVAKSSGFKIPSIPIRINQKTTEKQKPIIKSCEPAHFDIKFKHPLKSKISANSDVSIIDDEVSFKKQKASNIIGNQNNYRSDKNKDYIEEKLSEDILQHPFLTYDSEDILNEEEIKVQVQLPSNNSNKIVNKNTQSTDKSKIENKRTLENSSTKNQEKLNKVETEQKLSSSEKKKKLLNNKIVKNEPFGSKENPKLLASWIPCVIYSDKFRNKCNLTFEGKLLNEAGHVLHRKFMTDPICQRHSAKLIETVNNEYFKLSGELNNTKHVIPTQLLKQCRTGCPSKIKDFCEEWKKLCPVSEHVDTTKSLNTYDVTIDQFIVPTSSRGRRIVPRLSYWEGERILTKDNNLLYNPGNIQDASLVGKSEGFKKSMPLSEQRPQRKNNTNEGNTRISKSSTKPSNTENITSNPKSKEKPVNKRIAQQLKYSSSSDSSENEPTNKRTLRRPRQISKENQSLESQQKRTNPPVKVDILTESAYNTKLRKRQKIDKEQQQQKAETYNMRLRVPSRKPTSEVVWTYEKEQQYEDILSDDQPSVIGK